MKASERSGVIIRQILKYLKQFICVNKYYHQAKREEFQQRWEKIRRGKEAVETNKNKFKPFIREKQGKIEDGLSRIEKEKSLQNQIVKDMKELNRDFKIHSLAKVIFIANEEQLLDTINFAG